MLGEKSPDHRVMYVGEGGGLYLQIKPHVHVDEHLSKKHFQKKRSARVFKRNRAFLIANTASPPPPPRHLEILPLPP